MGPLSPQPYSMQPVHFACAMQQAAGSGIAVPGGETGSAGTERWTFLAALTELQDLKVSVFSWGRAWLALNFIVRYSNGFISPGRDEEFPLGETAL